MFEDLSKTESVSNPPSVSLWWSHRVGDEEAPDRLHSFVFTMRTRREEVNNNNIEENIWLMPLTFDALVGGEVGSGGVRRRHRRIGLVRRSEGATRSYAFTFSLEPRR